MNLTTQRRLAADILKVGLNRVWIDPEQIEEVSRAITRDGVRQLIDQGAIKAKPQTGISSYRSKKIAAQKKKGRRKGKGSVKGAKYARTPKKQAWMSTIRALRTDLRLWNTSAPILIASVKEEAPTGVIMNSWKSTLLSA